MSLEDIFALQVDVTSLQLRNSLFVGVDDTREAKMMSYEKLDVYQCAIQFLAIANEITTNLPRGQKDLSDQINRAAMSIPLNIGEGAGKRTKPDCRKYFDNARGSAMECAAAIDVCKVLRLVEDHKLAQGKTLLHRIVSMLTKLARQ
jgi:four helix bundle protein